MVLSALVGHNETSILISICFVISQKLATGALNKKLVFIKKGVLCFPQISTWI